MEWLKIPQPEEDSQDVEWLIDNSLTSNEWTSGNKTASRPSAGTHHRTPDIVPCRMCLKDQNELLEFLEIYLSSEDRKKFLEHPYYLLSRR